MKLIKYIFRADHLIVTMITVVMLVLLSLFTFNVSFMNPVAKAMKNLSMTDIFYKMENASGTKDTCQLITIVDMTELTERGAIGEFLNKLYSMNPAIVGIDLIFEGEKDDIEGNLILEESVETIADKAVFANKLIDYDEERNEFTQTVHSYFSSAFQIEEGYANITDNMENSTIRMLTLTQNKSGKKYYSFPAQIAKKMGAKVDNDKTGTEVYINYSPTIFPTISYKDLEKNKQLIEGHIVFVGAMQEEQDMHLSPLGKTSGLEIQAYSTLTLLEHKNIKSISLFACFIIGFILCYLFELLIDITDNYFRKKKSRIASFLYEAEIPVQAVSVLFLLLVTFCSFALFIQQGIYVDTILILALSVLVLESRNLYHAFLKTFKNNKS